MSKLFNKNFRVKVGNYLVGWSGFCSMVGEARACHLLCKALKAKSDKVVFKYRGLPVSFYVK